MPRSMVVVYNKLPPYCYLRFISLKRFSLHKRAYFSIHVRTLSSPFGLKNIKHPLCVEVFLNVPKCVSTSFPTAVILPF